MFHAEYFQWRTIHQLCPQPRPPTHAAQVWNLSDRRLAPRNADGGPRLFTVTRWVWSCRGGLGTHPVLGPATVAAPQNERMERERESSHQGEAGRRCDSQLGRGTDALSGEWVFACSSRPTPVSQYSSRREELLLQGATCRASPVNRAAWYCSIDTAVRTLCLYSVDDSHQRAQCRDAAIIRSGSDHQKYRHQCFISQEKWIFYLANNWLLSGKFLHHPVSQYLV